MDLSHIESKIRIKNYQEFCKLLSEPVLTGCSKIAQMKYWSKFFAFHKEGRKRSFVIDEVYSAPLPDPIDVRDVYSPLFLPILYDLIEKNEYHSFLAYKLGLYGSLGLVNQNLLNKTIRYKKMDEIKKDFILSQEQFMWVYNCFSEKLNRDARVITDNALGRLQEKGYIKFSEVLYYHKNKIKGTADEWEQRLYEHICEDLKKDLNIAYINIYNTKKYYSELNRLVEKYLGWEWYSKTRRFYLPYEKFKFEGVDLSEEAENAKRQVNALFIEKLTKKADEEFYDVPNNNSTSNSITHKQYVRIQHKLIDTFVKI